MRKDFFKTSYIFFGFIFLLTVTACNNGGTDDQQPAAPTPATGTTQPEASLIGENLYVIYTDRQTFLSSTQGVGRMLFSHVATSGDSITLHGWRIQGQDFGAPILQMQPGIASGLTYQAGKYLNNVFIRQNVLVDIRNKLRTNTSLLYVAFVPQDSSNYIKYRIHATTQDPKTTIPSLIETTTFIDDANPSPPKNYN